MLPELILTVSTRVSRYQVQSKTSLHLTSSLPRAWHLPFCPKNECAGFRVHGGKNNAFSSMGGSPFKFVLLDTEDEGKEAFALSSLYSCTRVVDGIFREI